ncbi:hypothetical protein [Spirilliplanes yamanashiensis]|uniref:Uncharacterized protein n=1 Tax=Spirilliplanes yamanashiensis TaxID=42233 RepID=A0A8J4DK97_9ACTN|nr:hypothetical protein [Spirilliplanes yamanashiensis]MDP9815571.1 hypothetical protein [Spirilliplanes yamanashiensis]GIJ03825.1 hypothetical protein Sya03_31770 [Spirilliplanes yamanashiensis]
MTTNARFNLNGVFRDQCEPTRTGDAGGASFTGAPVRGLMRRPDRQADPAHARAGNRADQYGSPRGGRRPPAVGLVNAAPL